MDAAAGMDSLPVSSKEIERRSSEAESNNATNNNKAGDAAASGVLSTSPKSELLPPPEADVAAEDRRSKEIEEKERQLREEEERERRNRDLRAGLHPLQHRFVFWYTRRMPGNRSQTSYEDNMKKIAEFSTVEGFWSCYCHLARPSTLPNPTDFHLFKDGIRPLWEDAANRNGGKWIIRFKKLVSGRFWEDLVLAIVGDQLEFSDSVCGAVLSIRFGEDILSIWNRNSSDNKAVLSLRDSIKHHLHLPHSYLMEYKAHDASLRDKSSFRNAWIRN